MLDAIVNSKIANKAFNLLMKNLDLTHDGFKMLKNSNLTHDEKHQVLDDFFVKSENIKNSLEKLGHLIHDHSNKSGIARDQYFNYINKKIEKKLAEKMNGVTIIDNKLIFHDDEKRIHFYKTLRQLTMVYEQHLHKNLNKPRCIEHAGDYWCKIDKRYGTVGTDPERVNSWYVKRQNDTAKNNTARRARRARRSNNSSSMDPNNQPAN